MADLRTDENYSQAADACVCDQVECDDCHPGEAGHVGRPDTTFHDLVKGNILESTHDTINACWNSWEMACRFQDAELAQYYLDLMTLTTQFQKKVKALKKKV